MTARAVLIFLAGLVCGIALTRGCAGERADLELTAAKAELRDCRDVARDTREAEHREYTRRLESAMDANDQMAATLYAFLLTERQCEACATCAEWLRLGVRP